MSSKRKSKKRRNRNLRAKRYRHQDVAKPSFDRTADHAGIEAPDDQESWYSAEWLGSRAGARASRGFHFQDAVGAWFAARMASGDLAIDCLIPEGFDDLQLDAPEPVQVEVKSRQGRLGQFSVSAAAKHIVDAWFRHEDRFGTSRRLIVVLEHGLVVLGRCDRTLRD